MRKSLFFRLCRFLPALTALQGALVTGQVSTARSAEHPLDPLAAEEYTAAVSTLKEAAYTDLKSRYPLITLEEPPKDDVLKCTPGDETSRRAFVIVKKGPETFEAVVDVSTRKVCRLNRSTQHPY